MKTRHLFVVFTFAFCLSSCALFPLDSDVGSLTQEPKNIVEPSQFKLTSSDITVNTKVDLATIQNEVESKLLTSPIQIPKTHEGYCKQIYVRIIFRASKWLDSVVTS